MLPPAKITAWHDQARGNWYNFLTYGIQMARTKVESDGRTASSWRYCVRKLITNIAIELVDMVNRHYEDALQGVASESKAQARWRPSQMGNSGKRYTGEDGSTWLRMWSPCTDIDK